MDLWLHEFVFWIRQTLALHSGVGWLAGASTALIRCHLAHDAPVTISIYDAKGQLIRTIALGNRTAGIYTTKDRAGYWDGRNSRGQKVSSGVYYYTLQAGEFIATRKMVILK